MSCTICNDPVVFNAKRGLCRKCYSAYYRKNRGRFSTKEIINESEIKFIKNYFKHSNWQYVPCVFRLDGYSYTPDFYDGETNTFIEVVGSRQAYHQNKPAYEQFRALYPKINFEIRKITGEIVGDNGDRMDWSLVESTDQ